MYAPGAQYGMSEYVKVDERDKTFRRALSIYVDRSSTPVMTRHSHQRAERRKGAGGGDRVGADEIGLGE
jgi:hypothetical protein